MGRAVESGSEAPDAQVVEFERLRPLLFAIAYRMLGSASEAEDIVQEAYLRWRAAEAGEARSAKAFLSTVVTRLCLDQLKSARATREQYIGPWLPEPVLTAAAEVGPLATVEQRESIELAFLMLLERLTPQERAVFLLREVFDEGYDEIAEIIGTSPANCRQIFHRARQRLAERRPRFAAAPEVQRRLVNRFRAAAEQGDLDGFQALLAADVVAWSDGGGRVAAARRPIVGAAAVARFLAGISRLKPADTEARFVEVNGGPAVAILVGGALFDVMTFELADENRVASIRTILNPDKLTFLARQLGVALAGGL